ncbi:hypothetical protein CQJ94_19855 [Glycomyces fuscus]|nr:hypothetical protein CQJ94_19855 [Glycomyces fuscus]
MASSTGQPGAVSRETYWKRRAFVLAVALLALALIAYACRPNGEESGEPTRSDAGVEASPSVPPAEPSADGDKEPEADPSEGAQESADPSGDAEDAEDSGGAAAGGDSAGGGGGGEVPAPERPEDACRPQDIVVTFEYAEEDQEVYGAGANPAFRITVVNTAEQTCTVDVGGEALEVRIHSGDDRIFSTADCAEGEEKRQISRGVPHEYTFTWERLRSFEDCRDTDTSARPGWYRANLHGDYAGDQPELPFQLKA